MTRPRREKVQLDWTPPKAPGPACAHPGCTEAGEFKAPKTRDPRDGYHLFCLEHVRAYNAGWNFFAGMSQTDIEHYQRRDSTWHRPTWKLGEGPDRTDEDIWVHDDLGLLGELGPAPGPKPRHNVIRDPREREALATLGIEPPVTLAGIKTRYKTLAKKYHPDRSGGDKKAEERFKEVNQAYTYLMSCGYT